MITIPQSQMAVRCHWFDFVLKIFWPGFALRICWSAWHLFHFLFYWFNTMPEIISIDIVSSALYQFVDGQVLFVKVNITIYSYLEIVNPFKFFSCLCETWSYCLMTYSLLINRCVFSPIDTMVESFAFFVHPCWSSVIIVMPLFS